MTPILSVRGLTFAYPAGEQVLHGIDLEVRAGERVALLGPNGAGKTTFLQHLIGILGLPRGERAGRHSGAAQPRVTPPSSTSSPAAPISVAGMPLSRETVREARRRIGLVFQDAQDQVFMPTVRRDVAFGPANYGVRPPELDALVEEVLDVVGAGHLADRATGRLSAGERRRVAIAGVLALRPDLLALDEPTADLDPGGREALGGLLAQLGLPLLLVTHDLPFAAQVCTRAVVMDGGRVVADGPIRDVLGDAQFLRDHHLPLPVGFHFGPTVARDI